MAEQRRQVHLLDVGVWPLARADAVEKVGEVAVVELAAIPVRDRAEVAVEYLPAVAVPPEHHPALPAEDLDPGTAERPPGQLVAVADVVVRLSEPGEMKDVVSEVLEGLHLREDVTHHRTGLPVVPRHGGKSASTAMLYAWARPRTVVLSQRMPAVGSGDALTPLERNGIPLLRTWQRGAVHPQWRSDQITTEGFVDHHDQPRSRPLSRGKMNRQRLRSN